MKYRVTVTELLEDEDGGWFEVQRSTFEVDEDKGAPFERLCELQRAKYEADKAESERRETLHRNNLLTSLAQAPMRDLETMVEVDPVEPGRIPGPIDRYTPTQRAAYNLLRRFVCIIDHMLWCAARSLTVADYSSLHANIAGATVTVEQDSRRGAELVIRTRIPTV